MWPLVQEQCSPHIQEATTTSEEITIAPSSCQHCIKIYTMRINNFDDIQVHKYGYIPIGWAKLTYSNVISLPLCEEVHHPPPMKVVVMIDQLRGFEMKARKAVEVYF